MHPFIKWAGGKRWLVQTKQIEFPSFDGRYIEPFLGGGAIFFHLTPPRSILSDLNPRLIETYKAIRDSWPDVVSELTQHQKYHSKEYYYEERGKTHGELVPRAAQFLYLNRTCFNGLYRENLSGKFNVPIGSKTSVLLPDDNFELASQVLQHAELISCDFEETLSQACEGDLVFVDPPYTTAHNLNGFIKYNQTIFSWGDQLRLKSCVVSAKERGAKILLTNAHHKSILELYKDIGVPQVVSRVSLISGQSKARTATSEVVYTL